MFQRLANREYDLIFIGLDIRNQVVVDGKMVNNAIKVETTTLDMAIASIPHY